MKQLQLIFSNIPILFLTFTITLFSPAKTLADKNTDLDNWQYGDLPNTLVLAMDGVPFQMVEALSEEGYFSEFFPPTKLVSTFPSMTDVAFGEIFAMEPTEGYQQVYYSYEKEKVIGSLGSEMFKLEDFERHFDAIVHDKSHLLTLYLTSYRAARKEWNNIEKTFFETRDKPVFYGYIAGSDAIGHRFGPKGLSKHLREIDTNINDLREEYYQRTDRELNVIILSDHGNTLVKGKLIDFSEALKSAGFSVNSRVTNDNSVATTVAGVVGYLALYSREENTKALAAATINVEGVDLVMYRNSEGTTNSIVIEGADGVALVEYDPVNDKGSYLTLTGDPLGYGSVIPTDGTPLSQHEIFRRTTDSTYPNAIYRIYRCFYGSVKNPATVIASLQPGYEFSSKIIKSASIISKRWGTHGGLHRADSLGVYMRTDRPSENISADAMATEIDLDTFKEAQQEQLVIRD